MKKSFVALVSACVFVFLISGCGSGTSSSTLVPAINLADGSWELIYDNYNPQQITLELALALPKFEGKSKEEWHSYAESIGKVDNSALIWASGASLFPDGSTVVYHSNKDCIDVGGMSVFAFDLNTGEERILLKSKKGEYYSLYYWLDNSTLLCSSDIYDGQVSKTEYLICRLDGKVIPVTFHGESPRIYAARGRFLSYQPDGGNSRIIYFGHFDNDNQWVETNRLEVTGGYPINSGAISTDGTLLAFPLRNPDPNNNSRTMNIWDISSDTLIPIPDPVITGMGDPAASWPRQDAEFLEVVYVGTGKDGNSKEQLWRYVLPKIK